VNTIIGLGLTLLAIGFCAGAMLGAIVKTRARRFARWAWEDDQLLQDIEQAERPYKGE